MITYGSVCSGIEAATVAWQQLGWKAAWLSEIEPFPSAVLQHHYPRVPNLGDMTKIKWLVESGFAEAPEIIVGGTPCQAFSVAGARNSLEDERGRLTLEYVRLLNAIDIVRRKNNLPESICVWENVPGVLNTKDNAFGCFLAALVGEGGEIQPAGGKWTNAGCVFGPQRAIAWRVLDAQYFGLAQRRKRVFVVASARNRFDPSEILFERDSVRRDSAPSREEGESITANAGTGFTPTSFGQYKRGIGTLRASGGDSGGGSEVLITNYRKLTYESFVEDETASTMAARDYKSATDLICSVHGTQDPIVSANRAHAPGRNNGQENAVLSFRACGQDGFKPSDVVPTLLASDGGGVVPSVYGISGNWIGRKPENGGNAVKPPKNISPCLTKTDRHGVSYNLAVRRLTPIECERLQGFPDNYTQISWREAEAKDCPDSHRYKAIGNSMAVPVMRWIGKRIDIYLSNTHG